jgi:hypothetical protein
LRSRMVVPLDFQAIRKYKLEDSPEQNLWNGRFIVWPMPVMSLSSFENSTRDYYIVTTRDNWLLQKLDADGSPAEQLDIDAHSKDITGAMPLCHGEPFVYERHGTLATARAKQSDRLARNLKPISSSGK